MTGYEKFSFFFKKKSKNMIRYPLFSIKNQIPLHMTGYEKFSIFFSKKK
jgi:hypothetical protein